MKPIKLVILLVLATSVSIFAQLKTESNNQIDQKVSGNNPVAVDARPLLEKFNEVNGIDIAKLSAMPLPLRKTTAWGFKVNDKKSWFAQDLYTATLYNVPSTCRKVGTNCYIFVEDSSWTSGKVDQTAVDSIQAAFDLHGPANSRKGIYQINTETFGNPPDVDNDPRIIILILNIRDMYNGTTNNSFTAGFFSSINELANSYSNRAEMYYLDCYPATLTYDAGRSQAMKACAHEFQHMINYNYSVSSSTFFNEAMSMCAEVVNGYAIRDQARYNGETNHYLLDWRTGDIGLNDYSRAARYSVYLWEQFGTPFIKNFVQSGSSGIAGINSALTKITQTGTPRNFSDALEDWFIANALNDNKFNARWGYTTPNTGTASYREHIAPNITNYTDAVAQYGAQYISYTSGSNLKINFNTLGNSYIKIKAIKYTTSSKVVETVTPGVDYSIPDFGTTYPKVTFIVYTTDQAASITANNFSYTSTGTSSAIPPDMIGVPEGKFSTYWFGAPNSGYFAGTNSFKIRGLYQRFDIPGTAQVTEIRYYFADKTIINGTADPVTFMIKAVNTNGSPGTVLFTKTGTTEMFLRPTKVISAATIPLPATPAVKVSNSFFVGFEWDSAVGNDEFCMFSSSKGGGGGKRRAWIINSANTPEVLYDSFTLDIDLAIGVKLNTVSNINQMVDVIPSDYKLYQNYPNPFNPATAICFQLPFSGNVSIRVYDMLGREVSCLLNEEKAAGSYKINWNGADNASKKVTSGIYFYTIKAGSFVETKKMVLMK